MPKEWDREKLLSTSRYMRWQARELRERLGENRARWEEEYEFTKLLLRDAQELARFRSD